jgi:outer membrane protein assembly factor BamB
MDFEDIPGVMGRSNLRAKAAINGYNIVDVRADSIIFSEKTPGVEKLRQWTAVKMESRKYDLDKKFTRPDYSINERYANTVKSDWDIASDANIISTPAVADDKVIVGNQKGEIVGVSMKNGKNKWSFQTNGAIFSSPAVAGKSVVFGSGDGNIYCLETGNGKLKWKKQTSAAVLGAPLINGDTVFIGGSSDTYYALDLRNGNTFWEFNGLDGPVVSTPLLYAGKLIFGAWDRNLYAVSSSTGKLSWQWNNGSSIRNYSPASCIPVANDGVVYVIAPDRYISAIDVETGKSLWRNNDGGVRESIGISADGKWIYGKSMQDTIVAYAASREKQSATWKMHCGFGYEHVPSMLIEKDGFVFFGTKNGVVYCIDPKQQKIIWAYKIDNSMVNTVRVLDKHTIIASTMDGKVARLKGKGY